MLALPVLGTRYEAAVVSIVPTLRSLAFSSPCRPQHAPVMIRHHPRRHGPFRYATTSSSSAAVVVVTPEESKVIVRIGRVERPISDPSRRTAEHRRRIPRGYLACFRKDPVAQSHLQWLMQKDVLQQDSLLVGYSGGDAIRRRRLAMAYAELTQQPVELLTISQDTSESDLKQRRSLVTARTTTEHGESPSTNSSSSSSSSTRILFQDQAPVRAAIHGHLLILDGLHRAERNVLPTLNNLLENREMPLEDGRLLVSPQRYKFLQQQQQRNDQPIDAGIVPVHPDFKVLALLSHDPNSSHLRLDPPVRSRFQIRRMDSVSTDTLLDQLLVVEEECRNTTVDIVTDPTTGNNELEYTSTEASAKKLAMFATAMIAETSRSDSAPTVGATGRIPFPLNTLPYLQKLSNRFPHEPVTDLLERVYPYGTSESRLRTVFQKWPVALASREMYQRTRREMKLTLPHSSSSSSSSSSAKPYEFDHSEVIPDDACHVHLHFASWPSNGEPSTLVRVKAPSGGMPLNDPKRRSTFVSTAGLQQVVTAMLQEHSVGRDILLVSPKGEGKSVVADFFCAITGYRAHLFPLYKEMTAIDLLVRRGSATTSNTNTSHSDEPVPIPPPTQMRPSPDWSESPLLFAARTGQVCILDGIEKLSRDCLATLQGLLTDREVHLPDGTKYSHFASSEDGTIQVHGSFRVIGLASIAHTGRRNAAPTWLSEDTTSMFSTIAVPAPTRECIHQILAPFNKLADSDFDKLLHFHEKLLVSADDCGVSPMSIRTMKRIVRMGKVIDGGGLYEQLCSSLLIDLLPPTKRAAFESLLRSCKIVPTRKLQASKKKLRVTIDADGTKIGTLIFSPLKAKQIQLVPNPIFMDIPSHMHIIQTLLRERAAGERAFLLLGNQGTGKNKICDRLCELLNHEREYIQLHRDTTIGQLTISPSLQNGHIVWNDSPLVRAVIHGRALVVDEADKAPLEVVAVLKSLVEDGELLLADGRRITRQSSDDASAEGNIVIHPDFTVWVLANRPGKLFHGNDFFSEIGDCFAAHVVPNPDMESEVQLLQSYAPNIDENLLTRLSASFTELRTLFESGDVAYPYSTREAVAVVKHLHRYPEDSITVVLHNVLDLDTYDEHQYQKLGEVFRKHNFNFDSYGKWLLGNQEAFSEGSLKIEYVSNEGVSVPPPLTSPKVGRWDENNEAHVGGNQWQGGTGGSDTAGLGGRGGPYRLDRGHKVHQVSDEAKAQVSEEAKAAARRIAKKAFAEKLQEIGMSESEHESYSEFLAPIHNDIANLRAALRSVEYKASERDWIKNQLDGDLDDSKLIEGIAGEKHIYKRRGTIDPSLGNHILTKPKRLRFVVDCSGSMYRFNSYDERLNRCLQATALVMESFDGMKDKFDYSIVGHSGDSRCIDLVPFGEPPTNAKDRMRILQTMIAHSQFCESGDNTLAAMKQAMSDVTVEGYNDDDSSGNAIVIAISDANLERYGITPKALSRVMQSRSDTTLKTAKAYCIFIASFGDEAESIKRELPVGRGFVCMNSGELPHIVRNILMSEID